MDGKRLAKAKALVAAGAVWRDGDLFKVQGSAHNPYTVSLDAGYCSCPDRWGKAHGGCKHLMAAQMFESRERARTRRRQKIAVRQYDPTPVFRNLDAVV